MGESYGDTKVLAERIHQLEKRMDERFEAEQQIRDREHSALNARLETMNEFRAQLNRQAGSFVTYGGLLAVCTAVSILVEIVARFIH